MKTDTKNSTTALRGWTRILGAMLTIALMMHTAVLAQTLAPVILGKAANYAALAKSGVSTTGVTAITGDIGISPAAATFITGFGLIADPSNTFSTSSLVSGKIYAADYAPPTPTILTSTIGDMETAYADAAGRTSPDHTELGAGDITSLTLVPGLYKWGTGVGISGAGVTISGSATDVWIFQIAQDLTVANGAIVTLSGGALASNIFWQVAGHVTIGTTAQMKGNILCATLIDMQTGSTLNGRALAQTAVTLDAPTIVRPPIPAVYINPAPVNLLTAGNFRVLAGTAVTIGIGCTVTGDVGISPGITLTQSGTLIGSTHLNDATAIAAQGDLTTAFNDAAARTPDATIGTELGGITLGCGVYAASSTSFGITGTLVLSGTATDIFIFQMPAGTLITAASSVVTLTGGAVATNVYWEVGSSATLASNSFFKGNILAFTSITENSGATMEGKALARNAAVTLNGTSLMPVEIVAFTGTANRTNANLHWSTATEVHNYGFDIERRQTSDWAKVGFVAGAGSSSSPKNYSFTDNNLPAGRYTYRLKQIDNSGAFAYYGSVEVEIASVPQVFALSQNYPNPFNPSTKIQYSLANAGQVSLKVYNLLGSEVATLVNDRQEAGTYTVSFNANKETVNLSSGVYIYRLNAGSFVSTKKLVLMK